MVFTSHTCAAESIVGQEEARVARTNIRTICIVADVLTEMQAFKTLMDL